MFAYKYFSDLWINLDYNFYIPVAPDSLHCSWEKSFLGYNTFT